LNEVICCDFSGGRRWPQNTIPKNTEFTLSDDLTAGIRYAIRVVSCGLEYISVPACLLRREDIALSLVAPRSTPLFAKYDTIRSGSPLARHGIAPQRLRPNTRNMNWVWSELANKRADALASGDGNKAKEIEGLCKEIEDALALEELRSETVPQIAAMNQNDRSTVSHTIARAIELVSAHCPEMGDHLEKNLRRGPTCRYTENGILWYIDGLGPFPSIRDLVKEALWLKAKGKIRGNIDWALECGVFGYATDADGNPTDLVRYSVGVYG
jgi:hypothetical protein